MLGLGILKTLTKRKQNVRNLRGIALFITHVPQCKWRYVHTMDIYCKCWRKIKDPR